MTCPNWSIYSDPLAPVIFGAMILTAAFLVWSGAGIVIRRRWTLSADGARALTGRTAVAAGLGFCLVGIVGGLWFVHDLWCAILSKG